VQASYVTNLASPNEGRLDVLVNQVHRAATGCWSGARWASLRAASRLSRKRNESCSHVTLAGAVAAVLLVPQEGWTRHVVCETLGL
jgi:hypothetical protein